MGLLPRWYGIVWPVLGSSILVSWILPLFNPPDWLLRLQPSGFLPHLPTDPMRWGTFTLELALGLGMMALGLVAYRRRDIAGRWSRARSQASALDEPARLRAGVMQVGPAATHGNLFETLTSFAGQLLRERCLSRPTFLLPAEVLGALLQSSGSLLTG